MYFSCESFKKKEAKYDLRRGRRMHKRMLKKTGTENKKVYLYVMRGK